MPPQPLQVVSVNSILGVYPARAEASKSPLNNSTAHAADQMLLATIHSSFATIPFRITSFADHHHLTPIESHLCKKQGRGWVAPPITTESVPTTNAAVTSLESAFTKKRPGGPSDRPMVEHSDPFGKYSYPECVPASRMLLRDDERNPGIGEKDDIEANAALPNKLSRRDLIKRVIAGGFAYFSFQTDTCFGSRAISVLGAAANGAWRGRYEP